MCEESSCSQATLEKLLQSIDDFHEKNKNKINPFWPQVDDYWKNRHLLFSRFDEWIQVDETWLYSVRPEALAIETAHTIKWEIILDAFGCLWGSAIGFARVGKKVICVELDKNRLEMARNNARVYGVEEQITFIHGDIFDVLPELTFDTVYFDPPWWGTDYVDKKEFVFSDFSPDGNLLMEIAKKKTKNIVFGIPTNFSIQELIRTKQPFYLQKNILNSKHVTSTVYFWNSFHA